MKIDTLDALRALYAQPKERALKKQLRRLDRHGCDFIARSPFAVLASTSVSGAMDASPRGGGPGFVKVLDERTLLIPDEPGNNRLDTLENIIGTGQLGLIFLIPGVDETLRVNGAAGLSCDERWIDLCATERRRPKLVIRVSVAEAYLHCAKAFMRSGLWHAASRVDRACLPTMGQMISDQTGGEVPVESQEQMLKRYAADL